MKIPKKILVLICLVFTFGVIIGFTGCTEYKNQTTKDNTEEIKETKKETKKENTIESKPEYTFGNGNYICGKDFAPGTYDMVAIEGGGNVICMDNMLNTILGTKEFQKKMGSDDFCELEFKNAEFEDGQKLELHGVKVKLIRK